MLKIKTKLSTAYYLQTNSQIRQINLKLEQYLYMFINYRQKTQLDLLAIIKFTYSNNINITTKMIYFKVNYEQNSKIEFELRKKEKSTRVEKFIKEMKEIQEETKTVL